jgi:hypothetical protein
MASAEQSRLFPVFSQLYATTQAVPLERDIPDDRLDLTEEECDRTDWQDFLAYGREVRS